MFAQGKAGVGAKRGFTLIELLVVMGVMAILMSLLVPTLAKIREHVNIVAMESIIGGLPTGLDQYRTVNNAYPPDRHPGTAEANSALDKSSACLVWYLSGASIVYVPGMSPPDYPWRHPLYTDTSPSGSGRRATTIHYDFKTAMLSDQDSDLAPELFDRWGKRVIYNSGGPRNYNDGTNPNPYNQFESPKHVLNRYDIFCAGPDGKYGTPDDIRNWGQSPSLSTDYDYAALNPPNNP